MFLKDTPSPRYTNKTLNMFPFLDFEPRLKNSQRQFLRAIIKYLFSSASAQKKNIKKGDRFNMEFPVAPRFAIYL